MLQRYSRPKQIFKLSLFLQPSVAVSASNSNLFVNSDLAKESSSAAAPVEHEYWLPRFLPRRLPLQPCALSPHIIKALGSRITTPRNRLQSLPPSASYSRTNLVDLPNARKKIAAKGKEQ